MEAMMKIFVNQYRGEPEMFPTWVGRCPTPVAVPGRSPSRAKLERGGGTCCEALKSGAPVAGGLVRQDAWQRIPPIIPARTEHLPFGSIGQFEYHLGPRK